MRFEIPPTRPNPTRFPVQSLYGLDSEVAKSMRQRFAWNLDDAEYFMVFYKPIDEDVVSGFIPPPLKRLKRTPMISIFIQQRNVNGGRGNDALNEGYLEKITGAMVMHEGQLGFYPISILIESDMGAMLGRELFGTAKKVGRFNFERDGDSFKWQVYRREILLAELSGRISGEDADASNIEQLMQAPTYHLHQVPNCTVEDGHYAYPPRLMRNYPAIRKIHKLRACDDIRFNFNESPFDPICLMGPKEIYAVSYLNADTTLGPIEVVRDLDADAMTPFTFSKLDPF
jgi:acetoacetate decarboxylase